MTILSRCFTHQVAIPLLGIEVYYFLPCSQCFQSISLSLSTALCARITFGVLKMQIPRWDLPENQLYAGTQEFTFLIGHRL